MCKLYRLFFRLAPLRGWKSRLIRAHLSRCPRCAEAYGFDSRSLEAFLKPEWIEKTPGYWPEVRRMIASSDEDTPPASRRRRSAPRAALWLRVSAGAAALLLLGIMIIQTTNSRRSGTSPDGAADSEPAAEAGGISVSSQTLHGKPARAFYFQTKHASYVWIAPSKENGV